GKPFRERHSVFYYVCTVIGSLFLLGSIAALALFMLIAVPRAQQQAESHELDTFWQGTLSASEAAEQLDLSRSRLYGLATAYLCARAQKQGSHWTPGGSGGDHAAPWPQPVLELLRKRLGCVPPCPYSFAASEALRLHSFKLDRAQVRRWAIAHQLAHTVPPKRVLAPVRRWQRARIGELWQLDA